MTWLDVPPWLPVTAPRSNGTDARSQEALVSVVAQFRLDEPGRYTSRDISADGRPETFCNKLVSDVTGALGCRVPHVWLTGTGWRELLVQGQRDWLVAHGPAHGWEPLPDAHVAQAMADQGQVAVAVWCGLTSAHGHIAVLVPSCGEAGTWIAQAGAHNFSRGSLGSGFGALVPAFFGHP